MEYHHGASIGDCGAHWSLYAVGDTVGISPSGVDAYQARTLRELQQGHTRYSSVKLRMANEVATLLLFAIVFAVVLRGLFLSYWWATLLSFVAMGALIMAVVKIVNRKR